MVAIDLTIDNLPAYLASCGVPGPWRITPLGGGVSNTVLLAEDAAHRWVVKQSLAKLRVEEDWFADRSRIHRECAAIAELGPLLPIGTLPIIAFEDRGNCVYAMEAAPPDCRDWKSLLLSGNVSEDVARRTGEILRAMIHASRCSSRWESEFGDQTCFDQLRLDPYYRFTASRHPDLAAHFHDRIEACSRDKSALVHGDFSPKNLLVAPDGQVTLIDFEVIHFGDPAFDAAFLLNHLLLKQTHRPQWADAYRRAALAFWSQVSSTVCERSTLMHLGCLHLARVDGKSPGEYLTPEGRAQARNRARRLILAPPTTIAEVFSTHVEN